MSAAAPPARTPARAPRVRGEGQWALGFREPLNANERTKADDDGLNVRARIETIYAKAGFASIDPTDLNGGFRWWGLYTQRRPASRAGERRCSSRTSSPTSTSWCASTATAGASSDEPVAVIEKGTTPEQRVTGATLASVAEVAADRDLRSPAVIVVGEVAALADSAATDRRIVRHRGPLWAGSWLEDAAIARAAPVVPPSVRTATPVVVSFMIAPGVLADRAAQVAGRHGLLTAGTLAESPPFVDALVQRLTS